MTISRIPIHIQILDFLLFLWGAVLLVIFISGGFAFSIAGHPVSAYNPKNPAIVFGILFLLRTWLSKDRKYTEIPCVKGVVLVFQWSRARFAFSPMVWTAIFTGGYAVLMSIITVLKHLSYHSHAFDLGIFDQVLWNTVYGDPFYSSLLGRHFFGEHLSPILWLLAQAYRIYAHPAIILVLQSCALASGAIPVYWLAKEKLPRPAFAVLFVWLYVSYQPLRNVNLFDFHPVALVTPLLLFAFWCLERQQYLRFGILLVAALSCKEEISTIVFIFGVYLILVQKKRLWGGLLALTGIVIFFVDIWLIIPSFRNAPFAFVDRYSYLGNNVFEILKTLVSRPLHVAKHLFIKKKMQYIVDVFGPVGFLSFFSPSRLLLAAPTFIQNVLSNSKPQYTIGYQYTAPLTPFVFISAIYGLHNILNNVSLGRYFRRIVKHPPSFTKIAVILLWCSLIFFGHPLPYYFIKYRITPHTQTITNVLRHVPASVSVSAQETLLPHLSRRPQIYEFPSIHDAEYIVLDVTASTVPLSKDVYWQKAQEILRDKRYGVMILDDSVLLLKSGFSTTKNTQALEYLLMKYSD